MRFPLGAADAQGDTTDIRNHSESRVVSRAAELFKQIMECPEGEGGPAAYIDQMISRHEEESETLDFKAGGKVEGDSKERKRDVREIWSEALSGFANTGGGVLIWGVTARKPRPEDGVEDAIEGLDVAFAPDRLTSPAHFGQRLRDQILKATTDPVQGVEIRAVEHPGGGGYVVCLVPESGNKPHRAEAARAKNYYQRTSDNFVVISHPFLRSLFYPNPRSDLRPFAEMRFTAESMRRPFMIHLGLENVGQASASDATVWTTMSTKLIGADVHVLKMPFTYRHHGETVPVESDGMTARSRSTRGSRCISTSARSNSRILVLWGR